MQNSIRGEDRRTTVLCIDTYQEDEPAGRIYTPNSEKGVQFRGLTAFFRQMEAALDTMDLPQSFTVMRTFGRNPVRESEALSGTGVREGSLATFLIRILFRQNASWQGSVTWLEGGQSQSFRSALELILLMDSVLKQDENEEPSSA